MKYLRSLFNIPSTIIIISLGINSWTNKLSMAVINSLRIVPSYMEQIQLIGRIFLFYFFHNLSILILVVTKECNFKIKKL